jgi:hypothetical protein
MLQKNINFILKIVQRKESTRYFVTAVIIIKLNNRKGIAELLYMLTMDNT